MVIDVMYEQRIKSCSVPNLAPTKSNTSRIDANGVAYTCPTDICNEFNTHVTNVGKSLEINVEARLFPTLVKCVLNSLHTSIGDV